MAVDVHGAATARPPRRRGAIGGRVRRVLGPYVLIAPAAAFIGVIFLYSLVRLGYASLHSGDNGDTGPAQLDAYRFVLNDEIFRAVKHNLLLLIGAGGARAGACDRADPARGHHGLAHLPDVVFVPYILAIPVLGTTFIYLLSLDGGLNSLLRDVGLGFLAQDWLGSPVVGAAVDRRRSSSTRSSGSAWCSSSRGC